MAPGSRRGVLTTLAITLLTLAVGVESQDGFPFQDFNPVPYAPGFDRSRPFPRDVQHQSFQGFQQGFQPNFQQQPLDPPPFQYLRNATGFQPLQNSRFPGEQGDFTRLFQDPQFDQLFQRELGHQLQLESLRLQEQQHQQQQPPPPPPQQQHVRGPQSSSQVQIQQSVQLERPQLQELHELHSLLEQQLQLHEVRQKEQQQQRQQQQQLQQMILLQQQQQQQLQQQQQNLVDSHESHDQFMSQKIKTPPPPPPPRQPQPPPLQRPAPTTTPKAPLEVLDLTQFLPFLQQQQQQQTKLQQQQQQQTKLQQQQQTKLLQQQQTKLQQQQQQVKLQQPQQQENDKPQDGNRLQQQQRLRQQQRQQETLRQQEERRQQELRLKERQRQQRQQLQQLQQQQQRLQEQDKRQRQQRQQPTGNSTGGRPATEKQVTSVRDLFNTTSCIEPPLTCPHPRIHFYLYTRTTQESGQLVDVTKPESLLSTPFNAKHPIKVLIHGFQGGRQFSPSIDLRKAYFIRGDYNIFVVDYQTLVRLPCLSQIQWSPSFLALCTSQLVSYVGTTTKGVVTPDRFHLIGYSIGAHIAGLVANYVDRDKGKLGRITGLDPTIIFYQGANRSHDLDPSDANFIDVIHTGAGILGQRGPNGHVDYYVNGGTTQPGCQSDSLIKTLSCDHTKVSPYYVESIVTPVGFWALPCPNLFMYLLGFCQPKDDDYIIMGEDAPHTARGIYYLTTNANKPYAKGFPGKKMPIKFPKWRPN